MKTVGFLIIVGGLFAVVAGLMTFLISYNELVKHFATREIPLKISFKSAFVSFMFFLIMSVIIGFSIKYL